MNNRIQILLLCVALVASKKCYSDPDCSSSTVGLGYCNGGTCACISPFTWNDKAFSNKCVCKTGVFQWTPNGPTCAGATSGGQLPGEGQTPPPVTTAPNRNSKHCIDDIQCAAFSYGLGVCSNGQCTCIAPFWWDFTQTYVGNPCQCPFGFRLTFETGQPRCVVYIPPS
jgi:hypothetical protein